MRYKHLSFEERCQIYGLWRAGHSQTEVAKEVGVHKSTISREFKRNIVFVRTALGSWQYKPDYAQTYAEERHKKKFKYVKFTKEVEAFVREKLLQDWSPEQISGYAKRHSLFFIVAGFLKMECYQMIVLIVLAYSIISSEWPAVKTNLQWKLQS